MSVNNVKPSAEDAEWKRQVEIELTKLIDNQNFLLQQVSDLVTRVNR